MWSPAVESRYYGQAFFSRYRIPLLTVAEPFTEICDESQLVSLVLGQHGPHTSETDANAHGEGFIHLGEPQNRCSRDEVFHAGEGLSMFRLSTSGQ